MDPVTFCLGEGHVSGFPPRHVAWLPCDVSYTPTFRDTVQVLKVVQYVNSYRYIHYYALFFIVLWSSIPCSAMFNAFEWDFLLLLSLQSERLLFELTAMFTFGAHCFGRTYMRTIGICNNSRLSDLTPLVLMTVVVTYCFISKYLISWEHFVFCSVGHVQQHNVV